jgi:hypothetical protein
MREVTGQPREQIADPVGAAARESPQHRPAEKHRPRAESERGQHVFARSKSPVRKNLTTGIVTPCGQRRRSLARRSRSAMSTATRAPPVC